MHSQQMYRGQFPWRRLVAACGVATSLVALGTIASEEEVGLTTVWLLVAGLALAVLSLHALRMERRAQAMLKEKVAERDVAEQARRAAEARSLEIADTSPDLLTVHGPDGRLTHSSAACRVLLGYEPGELVGRAPDELVHLEDLPVLLAMRNRAREADDVSATFRLLRKDSRPIWVEVKLRVVRDPATGRTPETHAIVRDVDERLRGQRALAEAEARFRTAFEEGASGMAIVSVDGRIVRVNRALCAITGHQHNQGLQRPARLAAVVDRRHQRRARRGAARAPGPADRLTWRRGRSASTSCFCACATRSAS